MKLKRIIGNILLSIAVLGFPFAFAMNKWDIELTLKEIRIMYETFE